MSKIDWLSEEIIKEYKAGNNERRVVLQTLKAALQAKEKEKQGLSEEDEMAVLKSELKARQQAKAEYESGQRDDLVKKMDFEINEISSMLPEQMTDEEIEKIVQEVVSKTSDKSFDNVMKESMIELKGKADGGAVSQVVKRVLAPLEAK
ncbi:MAG: GatB/YqeY domain-containing protein [bacterium]